jgi:hypothetical protein
MPRVTPEIIERIKLMTNSGKSGMLQKQIARELKLCRSTVGKIQRKLGIAPHPGFVVPAHTERKILQLLKRNFGQPRITKGLGVPAHAVRAIMLKHHHSRRKGSPGHRYRFKVEDLRDIARDLRTGERGIAVKWGTTRAWISRFRNSWWDGTRRKKNASKPAAGIPQKPTDPDTAITLVQRVTGGKLPPPEYDDRLVEAILKIAPTDTVIPESIPVDFRETFVERVKGDFATGIKQALGVLRESQGARWKN